MERFWSKVKIGSENECWEWQANKHKQGYGFFKWGGINKLAHRISYMLKHGFMPDPEEKVMHTCDNPSCVNPNHLLLGSQYDNIMDMCKKGRHVGSAKLTYNQVMEIRASKKSYKELSEIYGLPENTIYYAATGRNWKAQKSRQEA